MNILEYLFKNKKPEAKAEGAGTAYVEFDRIRDYTNELMKSLEIMDAFNILLNSIEIEFDSAIHTKVTFEPKEWLNEGKQLSIIFSNSSGAPIYAYFEN